MPNQICWKNVWTKMVIFTNKQIKIWVNIHIPVHIHYSKKNIQLSISLFWVSEIRFDRISTCKRQEISTAKFFKKKKNGVEIIVTHFYQSYAYLECSNWSLSFILRKIVFDCQLKMNYTSNHNKTLFFSLSKSVFYSQLNVGKLSHLATSWTLPLRIRDK